MDVLYIIKLYIKGFELLNTAQQEACLKDSSLPVFANIILKKYKNLRANKTFFSRVKSDEILIKELMAKSPIPDFTTLSFYPKVFSYIKVALQARALAIIAFFPMQHNRLPFMPNDAELRSSLQNCYYNANSIIYSTLAETEEVFLAECIALSIEKQLQCALHRTNLVEDCRVVAKIILQAFNQKLPLPVDAWLPSYNSIRATYLTQVWLPIRVLYSPINAMTTDKRIEYLLSLLLGKEYYKDAATTKGFLQALGIIQHQGGIIALSDAVNVNQAVPIVRDIKTILYDLFKPFAPLYYEYKNLKRYEESVLMKFVRVIMPFAITLISIMAMWGAMVFFVTSPLADLIAIFPIIFIALTMATLYVIIKDAICNAVMIMHYGDRYGSPEFSLNQRMSLAFSGEDKTVYNFYLQEMQQCDKIIAKYAAIDPLIMTSQQLCERDENIKRHELLYGEWHDIHSNAQLGYDLTRPIVSKRFSLEADKIYLELKKYIEEYQQLLLVEMQSALQPDLIVAEETTSFAEQFGLFAAHCRKQNGLIAQFDSNSDRFKVAIKT